MANKWSEIYRGKGAQVSGLTVSMVDAGLVLAAKTQKRWSIVVDSNNSHLTIGVATKGADLNNFVGSQPQSLGYMGSGLIVCGGVRVATFGAYLENDTVEFQLETVKKFFFFNSQKLTIRVNGYLMGTITLNKGLGVWYPAVGADVAGGTVCTANF